MRFFTNIFCFWCLGVAASWCVCAPVRSDDLQPVKTNIVERILEYQQLQLDNERLKTEFEDIRLLYDQHLKELRIENNAPQKEGRGRIVPIKEMPTENPGSISEAEALMTVRQAQISHLKLTLLDLQEQERLWKLKTADDDYQKQMLELEYALKNTSYEHQVSAYLGKIEQLNREILRSRLEEKQLLAQFSMLEDEAKILQQQKRIFDNESGYLAREAGSYAGLRDQTIQEAEAFDQARKAAEESFDQALREKQQEKEALEAQLKAVEERQQSLDQQLMQALQKLQERQQLVSDILRLKSDNDRLQDVIRGMQAQVKRAVP